MTPADLALALFTACNSVRILAYLPQILRVGRDTNGATAISYTTWVLFGFSHLSTAGYALLVVRDPLMAAVFVGNAACCVIILGLTAYKRALHARAASGQPSGLRSAGISYASVRAPSPGWESDLPDAVREAP
jgi:hypothetical protein